MSSAKPVICMVPGAWHSPEQYALLREIFEREGYQTESIQLPSVGALDASNTTSANDALAIREKMLLPLIEQGKEIVLLVHSYGGCPGGASARGLSTSEQPKGGIIGMIFLAAFVTPEGASLQSSVGKLGPWMSANEETLQATVTQPIETFYNDVPQDLAEATVKTIQTHSLVAFASPSPSPAWLDESFKGRRAYVFADNDQTIPVSLQQTMVKNSGVEWTTRTMQSGHCPFLSKPQETSEVIKELIAEFQSV